MIFTFLAATPGLVSAATLSVLGVDKAATPLVPPTTVALTTYRWVLEEDTTYRIEPGVPVPETLSVNFHKSYMPVVAQGDETMALPALDPAKYYFVSVIPKEPGTYSIGGASFKGDAGTVTVHLNQLPLPTAQITVFVHEDLNPINNVWDEGEPGLEGFSVLLEDAGGRYGISAGMQMQDAFGNPLGTTYVKTCDQYGQPIDPPGTYGCLDADGNPIVATDSMGMPIVEPLITGPDGRLTIKNLAPGKYGITIVPPNAVEDPPGSGIFVGADWVQTSTIEGTILLDAWVKANEPPFFAEFGPPGPHTSFGFVPASRNKPYIDSTVLTGGATISGQIVNLHLSRPPQMAFHNGAPFAHTTPWVGLNQGVAGVGRGVYAARANEDGTFAIPNVPPGNYQLVVWDDNLDLIFAFHDLVVADVNIALGEVPVFQWFTRLENWVFYDQNENGFRDAGEQGIAEQNINLRWRDGSVYQAMATDTEGFVPFDEVFPFFAWLVAEVDFVRFKATGMTATVDNGGAIDPADPWTWDGQLNPQPQTGVPSLIPSLNTQKYRTERGPVLTQGFQGFLGQTSVLEWGKKEYAPGENGGISGIVFYSVTRAEDDPEKGAPEVWEPGIPRVTVNLYDATGTTLLNTTTTDSWDDSVPTGCQDDNPFVFRGITRDCYDGMRIWNQVRPAVFDGGYAFDEICQAGVDQAGNCAAGFVSPMPVGQYVVEVIPPVGYEVVKSQDKNVDFGDNYIPSPLLLPPPCVGTPYTVPPELTLFPGVEANLAGQELSNCDRKLVSLSDGANAAADFYLFTQAPVAGHINGFILDDLANEFDPASPQFGEKFAPPWLPVSVRDWTGRMITSVYSDENGTYNILVPSTYTANLPQPSGMSPNMLTACMNDPEADIDPVTLLPRGFFNPQYSTFCYTFQYMPGTTTYLDTPVIPVAAFAGPDQFPLDCEFPDGTPRIFSVTNGTNGPYLPTTGGQITITSVGTLQVPNPAYDGLGGVQPKTIPRDFGFGTDAGTVTVGGVPLTGITWGENVITGTVPGGTPTGQLVVTRGDNLRSSTNGVTVQMGLRPGSSVLTVAAPSVPGAYPGAIQAAIDAAEPNDLILVAPGTYNEMVIMWKPVQLQGWGEGTIINPAGTPPETLAAWRQYLEGLYNGGSFDVVDGQLAGFGQGVNAEPFESEEGSGVFVVANSAVTTPASPRLFDAADNQGARIDGFTIRGADTGGGVVVNGFAHYLEISNNRIINNSGFFNGGIRLGHPFLTTEDPEGVFTRTDANNDFIRISHNQVSMNGGFDGAGGGISLYNGSDNYVVSENFICGNFALQDGAGIGHLGMSNLGLIEDNTILFNENFNQMVTVNGGGISISGEAPITCPIIPETGQPDPACLADPDRVLTPGSGSVTISRNRLQGNSSGAGDGAGIRLSRINGQDIAANPDDDGTLWHRIDVINNMIVNNVAALAGGGISLQDAVQVNILHNTVAHNDSTATAGEAFTPGVPSVSNPQGGAGIASRVHGTELAALLTNVADQLQNPDPGYSNPQLVNNIIWQNRQFYFQVNDTDPANVLYGLCPDIDNIGLGCDTAPVFNDLAVLPEGTGALNPTFSLLTDTTGYDGTNFTGDPLFYAEYFNGNRESTITLPETTTAIAPTVAFDEGGNFIRLRYGPLTETRLDNGQPYGDYHIYSGSPAVDHGDDLGITDDFDGLGTRTDGSMDIGADENDGTAQPPAAPGARPEPLMQLTPGKKGNSGQFDTVRQTNSLAGQAPRLETSLEVTMPPSLNSPGMSGGEDMGSTSQEKGPAGSHSPDSDRAEIMTNATSSTDALDAAGTDDMQAGPVESPAGEESAELEDMAADQADTGNMPEASGQISEDVTSAATVDVSRLQETEAAPAAEAAGRMAASGTASREGRRVSSALPLASLIVLALGGLVFLIVLQPKSRKKKEQQRRGDI
jgi:hypothetical protein